jgi:hypothetical protein
MIAKRSQLAVCTLLSLFALVGSSTWAQETGPPDLEAEIWVAPAHQLATASEGDWGTTGSGQTKFSFAVPADFASFTSATVLVVGKKQATVLYDLSLSVGINSEGPHDAVVSALTGEGPVDLVKGDLLAIDASSVFLNTSMLTPEDALSLAFSFDPIGHASIIGLRFQYQARPALGGLECPPNQVVYGFDDEGQLLCRAACLVGEVFVGWDANGAPICVPDHQACPPETLMTGFDLDGMPICVPDFQACADDEVMVGFDLTGSPLCRADTVVCGKQCYGGANEGESCAINSECPDGTCQQTLLVGFDLRGNVDCRTLGALQQGTPEAVFDIYPSLAAKEGTDTLTPFAFPVLLAPSLGLGETDTVEFTTEDIDAVGGTDCGPDVDYISQTDTLEFTSADCDGTDCSKDIVVQVCADDVEELDESFKVVLSLPFGSTSVIANDTGIGLILDDDATSPTTATLSVTLSNPLAGAVLSTGIDCPGDCSETYTIGKEVSLWVRSRLKYRFVKWTGDDECNESTEEVLLVKMDKDKSCTAVFAGIIKP